MMKTTQITHNQEAQAKEEMANQDLMTEMEKVAIKWTHNQRMNMEKKVKTQMRLLSYQVKMR